MSVRFSALLALLIPVAAWSAPQTFVLDPGHTYPNFTIPHLGLSTIHGRFEKTEGKVIFDPVAKTGSFEVKIATASISTANAGRDQVVRSPSFFNTAEFPEAVYKSVKFNFNGDALESIDGTLTLLGVTKPLKLTLTQFKCGQNPHTKKTMCGGDAETSFKRSDFGMKYAVPAIGDEIKMTIDFEAYPE